VHQSGDHLYVRSQRCGNIYESAGLLGEAAIIPAGVVSTSDGTAPPHILVGFPQSSLFKMAAEIRHGGSPCADIIDYFRNSRPIHSEHGVNL
jgi:hypothetical protein